jgi:hypothetical protein
MAIEQDNLTNVDFEEVLPLELGEVQLHVVNPVHGGEGLLPSGK